MNLTKIAEAFKNLSAGSLIFAFFTATTASMFFLYTQNTFKLKQLQAEISKVQEENQGLQTQKAELYNQLDTQTQKSRELTNELIQLSEEKSQCYKNIIRYSPKLKKTALASPRSSRLVEPLVNNYFSRMFDDVAKTTGASKSR